MNDTVDNLQHIISLSNLMLEQAQSSLWDELTELELIRRKLIDNFFLTNVPIESSSIVSEAIRLIIAIDQQIFELGDAEKREIELVLKQIDQGKKAVKAYSI